MVRIAFTCVAALMIAAEPGFAQPSPGPTEQSSPVTSSTPANAPASPDLTVATVKLQGGLRTSKLIGATVYNDRDEKVGTVDDLIVKDNDRIVMVIVSVGGFLGMGNKLVALPYAELHLETNKDEMKLRMPAASKDALMAMPTFTYSG